MIHPNTAPKAGAAKPAPDCTLVIFGVTGDLTHRLLMPALYNLARWKLLPERFAIVGVGRSEMGTDGLRDDLTRTMQGFVADKGGEFSADSLDREAWNRVVGRLDYLAGDVENPATYEELSRRIEASREARAAGGNVLFYLAVAARLFGPVVTRLGEAGLTREGEGAWRRVIIEKPFGHDLPSARALNREVLTVLSEDQIFRIDHFLGKETVQNIMAFRFGNGLFEPLWNRDRIDHVQITVAETVGLMEDLGCFVVTAAIRQQVIWSAEGLDLPVAINVSPRQLEDPSFVPELLDLVTRSGVRPELIEVEVTETALISDYAETAAKVRLLRQAGLAVAIDDFGVGYSNLSHLSRLSATALKIDRSLIERVTEDEKAEAIIRAAIDMARALGLTSVAEGIETPQQAAFLASARCDVLQGFLYARPMPPADLLAWLAARRTNPVADLTDGLRQALS